MTYKLSYKRIVKNTLLLYTRTIIIMFISLYTTRIVLDALGIEDFGVYNVVLSTVTLVSFFIGVLSSSSQRFLTFELGTGNLKKLQDTFSTMLSMNLSLSIIVLILVEFIGLWFINTYLKIPFDRVDEAIYIFHIILISTIVNAFKTPFYAVVMAHEKMNIFAMISVVEAILKFFVAYLLMITSFDKLIFYTYLLLTINLLITVTYILYCIKKHQELQIKFGFNKEIFKSIIGFTGWNTMGGLAYITSTQGLNIIFNMFYGIVLNAAMAIAYQVNAAIENIASNLLAATTPQITKLYATRQFEELKTLLYRNSKYAFLLMWILVLPFVLNITFILDIWLINTPQYLEDIIIFLLVIGLVKSLNKPLIMLIHAIGDMKMINMTSGTTIILVLPIAYILMKYNYSFYIAFILLFLAISMQFFYSIHFLSKYIDINLIDFYKYVISKLFLVILIPLTFSYFMAYEIGDLILRLVVSSSISFLLICLTTYMFAFDVEEKNKVKYIVIDKIFSHRHKN